VGRLFNAPSENIVIRRVEVLKPLVWHFRAWRKSFPEGFEAFATWRKVFSKGFGARTNRLFRKK